MSQHHLEQFLDSKIDGCKNFKWREALYLRQWGYHALPDEDITRNIIKTAHKMQAIRDIMGSPIIITSWYRPAEYNKFIGSSAPNTSYHISGLACDFVVKGIMADAVREMLLDFLDRLDLRMEDLDGANWVHIDLGKPGKTGRFFKP